MYQLTSTGGQFLRYDSGIGDDGRILIFASDQGLELLSNSEHWFCDGTFKVCPEIFYQVYTIHALVNGRVLPCLFALLPNKNQQTYQIFFREISNLVPGIPQDILFDFERAAMNTMQLLLPNVEIKGCFFHLSSNIWKHIQSAGLQERYNEDPEFALHLRMLAALAFVPENNVIQYFNQLCDSIQQVYADDCVEILDYFENHYIGRFRRNAPRRPPLFSLDIWNMFHRTQHELPRTNNSIEGWHRAFQANVSAWHPTIYRFLDILKREESMARVSILQVLGGHPPPPVSRRYVDCNERILRIVDNFPNMTPMRYLRSIAHNLSL